MLRLGARRQRCRGGEEMTAFHAARAPLAAQVGVVRHGLHAALDDLAHVVEVVAQFGSLNWSAKG